MTTHRYCAGTADMAVHGLAAEGARHAAEGCSGEIDLTHCSL